MLMFTALKQQIRTLQVLYDTESIYKTQNAGDTSDFALHIIQIIECDFKQTYYICLLIAR